MKIQKNDAKKVEIFLPQFHVDTLHQNNPRNRVVVLMLSELSPISQVQ